MMTPDAKSALARTIRGSSGSSTGEAGLRGRLLTDLHNATEAAYRLGTFARDAGLDEAATRRRKRLERWCDEQVRAQAPSKNPRTADDFRREAEKEAAYTWLNRVIVLRLLEAERPADDGGADAGSNAGSNDTAGAPLRAPAVVTGGWESPGYTAFRALARDLVRNDETEGYATLLQLVFEDLAIELPGIFGGGTVADLIPMPPATLRHLVETLDDPTLATCWTDDMTLGWVYQYWNDPEREALDAKLNGGGKVERHEIASKTQMFTERYMVDWLLQNSLGPLWLALCAKHGWTPQCEADGTLDRLEQRRVDWRAQRDAGTVELTALMPLYDPAERRWAYYLPQPVSEAAIAAAPTSVRDLKLIDPAVGSGHFLVVAFELLLSLYREEKAHRGIDDAHASAAEWTDEAIVERILEHNLHGIDLDPRAVQIAAAALWLKAKHASPSARPRQLNLVASKLRLAGLPDDDPALVELRHEVEVETGIPESITSALIESLRGADHLGSLLRIDSTLDEALAELSGALGRSVPTQVDLLTGPAPQQRALTLSPDAAKAELLTQLERFLARHTSGDDLGLRLRGQQLAAGVRFVRMVREGAYDLVVANPPYQGTSKMVDDSYVKKHYPLGKADLYAAFLLRGLELVRPVGVSAMLTMRNWMFIKQFSGLRESLLDAHHLDRIGDFEVGAFEEVGGMVVSVCASVFARERSDESRSSAQRLVLDTDEGSGQRTNRKRAATLCHVGRHDFEPAALKVVPEWPLVYWWDAEELTPYSEGALIRDQCPTRKGLCTGDDVRFVRNPHEIHRSALSIVLCNDVELPLPKYDANWQPIVMGGKGRAWIEPLCDAVNWEECGLENKVMNEWKWGSFTKRVQSLDWYFRPGVAFAMIGSTFAARIHRFVSVFGNMGASSFPKERWAFLCGLNTTSIRQIASSLNPGTHFEVGDVNRLPLLQFDRSVWKGIEAVQEEAFSKHESHREPSVEFQRPGPSPWTHAQDWAQLAVDRPEGAPLPDYVEVLEPEPPTDHVSFALGVALGRFGADGQGVRDPTTDDVGGALPAGICFLDGSLNAHERDDSLGNAACDVLHQAWAEHGAAIAEGRDLRTWLRRDLFELHRKMYENRPIHWPLSSASKTFVAWVNIHRMDANTLRVLIADHLRPALARIEGHTTALRSARDGDNKAAAREAEQQLAGLTNARQELIEFMDLVSQCADQGAPPTHTSAAKCPPRAVDSRYAPVLDDGVMINSAGLWPLLDPQWNKPKQWWTELSLSKGKKDYDWSHLAMRYWPVRVDAKCRKDPSLGVAHGCFWKYHPAKAWQWELRLQDEITPDFRIEEAPYAAPDNTTDDGDGPHRDAYLREHAQEAIDAIATEANRRMRKLRKDALEAEMTRLKEVADENRKSGGKPFDEKKAKKAAKKVADAVMLPQLAIVETGLWTAHAAACVAMEEAFMVKQKGAFMLVAPDADQARAAFEAAEPEKAAGWRALVTSYGNSNLFGES